eukprot:scaffold1033_cov171-Amphora_coffeaeformis.AAC.19
MKALQILQTRVFVTATACKSPIVCNGLKRTLSTFRSLTAQDRSVFDSMIEHVTDDPQVLSQRNTEWTKHYQGNAKLVLQPETPEQISEILTYCQNERLAVVPQGGQTGLVGGGVATAGAEVILPIDLGAKGTCQIGGNLSTNAGGQYYYRYGSLAGNVLGLQVVLANGRILDLNYSRPSLKDNTGYKLHQLFLGAEGTLGVITAVALQCATYPTSQQTALLACETYDQVLQVLKLAKKHLSEILGALEFMDQIVVRLLLDKVSRIHLVNEDDGDAHPYYLLVETHGSNIEHDQAKMENFITAALQEGLIINGFTAPNESARQQMWTIRESANPSFTAIAYGYKYDVSVPVVEWDDFITDLRQHLTQTLPSDTMWVQGNWGHILDGNIHWNLAIPGRHTLDPRVLEQVEQPLIQRVLERKGSISAEHGLGQSKNKFLPLVHSEATLQTMRELKQMWDPNGILNPGKVLPPTTS